VGDIHYGVIQASLRKGRFSSVVCMRSYLLIWRCRVCIILYDFRGVLPIETMKALIASFNQKLGLNPLVSRLFDAMPDVQRAGVDDCEVVFLSFIAPESDFVPDKALLDAVSRRKLPVIIFDHQETFPMDFIFGASLLSIESHYAVIQSFIPNELTIKAYFKRELSSGWLLKGNYSGYDFPIYPIDWTLQATAPAKVDTREEYNTRPIDILFSWGYSNESRPRLMGELLRQAGRFNAHFCLTEQDVDVALQEGRERIFVLLFTPHYRRIHINKLMGWQADAKVSISLFGAGKKCFRHAEASYNCVMAHENPASVQWSHPWISGQNCIGLDYVYGEDADESGVLQLYEWLRVNQGSLYDIYLKGVENNRRYHNTTYAREYLWPKIQEAMK
jgi:hypothetical protein